MEGNIIQMDNSEVMQNRKRNCILGLTIMILIERFLGTNEMELDEETVGTLTQRIEEQLDQSIVEFGDDLLELEEPMNEFKEDLRKMMNNLT